MNRVYIYIINFFSSAEMYKEACISNESMLGLLVDYGEVFQLFSCFDSHSDGNHSQ